MSRTSSAYPLVAASLCAFGLLTTVVGEGGAARPGTAPQGELTLGGVCTPPVTPVRRRLASLGEVNSIGVAYFAGRSRGGNDEHLAAALTTELASQLLSARPRASGARGKDSGRLLVVKLSEGGGFTDVDLSMTGSLFRDETGIRTQVKLTRTSDGAVIWSGS